MISIKLCATGPGLVVKLLLDDQVFYEGEAPLESLIIEHDFDDDNERHHVLEINLAGKLQEHTILDEQGNIIEDRRLIIDDIGFGEISIKQLVYDLSEYHHDFNGTSDPIKDKFFGEIGCNGTVRLEFSSPVHIWLLENM